MDIHFEIDGEIIDANALPESLENPKVAQAMLRMAERIREAHGKTSCELHEGSPAVTVVLSETRGMGVRVSGCCQQFVDHIQDTVRKVMFHTARLTAKSVEGLNLIIDVEGTGDVFEFEVARLERVIIGRVDPDTGEQPEIDLSAYGAYENGVSRRHASIITWNRSLYIVDEGSPNGTFLNGERLQPHEPGPLKYGDHIRIGRLVLGITLDYPQQAAVS